MEVGWGDQERLSMALIYRMPPQGTLQVLVFHYLCQTILLPFLELKKLRLSPAASGFQARK